MIRLVRAVRLAIAFLTIVPIPLRDDEATPLAIADARFAYPLVGLLIGLVLAGLSEMLGAIGVARGPSAFLLVATATILSGGLHLDGLADTADGLFLWGDADRRLSVMRDPRVGSFGVVALVLVLLGKFVMLEKMGNHGRSLAILGASAVARSLVLVSAGLAPYARPEGTGRILVDATRPRDAVLAAIFAVVIGGATARWHGLIAALFAVGLALGLTGMARRKLGGVTGDTLGALIELGELEFLLALSVSAVPDL